MFKKIILARVREPSTLAAIGAGVMLFGGSVELAEGVQQAIGGVCLMLAAVLPEKAV